MSNTIVLTGGGTAGHVMPNIAMLPYLEYHFDKIVYIGSENGIEKKLITDLGVEYHHVTTVKLKRALSLQNFKIPFLLKKGVKEATEHLKRIEPKIIFSKGGFVSVPVLFAAKKLGIPYIIHESDYSMGLANKLTVKHAKRLLTTFEDTAKKYKHGKFCSSPIRDCIFSGSKQAAKNECKFSKQKPTLLIMGGSIGSKAINNAVKESLAELTKKYNIVHIVGKGNSFEYLGDSYYQMEFCNNISDFFALADMVICRSGSNTIFELLSIKKPMLLIPLSKKCSRGDQLENAKVFSDKGYADVLYEENLTSGTLISTVQKSFNNRHHMVLSMTNNKMPNAVKIILSEIIG